MSEQQGTFQSWAVLELLGHVRTAGLVSEQELFGTKMGRIDIPTADGFVTQFFGGSSVYRLTPTTEEIARSVAARNQPAPVHRWELPKPQVEQQEIPYYEPTEGHNHDTDDDEDEWP